MFRRPIEQSEGSFFEVEQERFLDWARARHGGDFLDEESEPYEALAQEYSDMNDAFEQEAEYQWLQRQSFHEQYIEFSAELNRACVLLRDSVNGPHTQTTCKLVYAHSVTLLETMISTSVNALVLMDKACLLNIARQIESIQKGKKISLVEIAEHPRGVEGVILKALSEITFHNPATIKTVLVALIGDSMKDLDVSGFGPICKVRHDIVHRNGKTVEDEPITLTPEQVYEAMDTIDDLASDISRRIFDAINDAGDGL
ncbi:hypothetical protein BW687_001490 [Pseudomonas graminis]|uniref:hypothetical protein n=1 Tax=Pseudomonas graminis TaxID=158627 RepID=UPI00234AB7ED|nr:hypothetical protein [Pseudomonas graminis]MDC6378854.1 hypothetical protein [Pseudomonas graminis]